MLSLVQLQYIVAVDTYRHFATAAEKCFITQPTLSMQIKKLEEDLGVKIFDRSKQPVVPTDVGERIIAQARAVLAEHAKIGQIVDDFTQTVAGELRIGIIPTLAGALLPRLLVSFNRAYPEVKLKVWERTTDELVEMLKQELLDVAIAVTPIRDADIKEEALFYEEILLYAAAGHPFCAMHNVESEALARPDLWLMGTGHCFRNQAINLCSYSREGLEGQGRGFEYASGSLDTLKKLVDAEGGFTLLPELYASTFDEDSQDRLKRIAGKRPLREVSLIYTRNFVKERLLNLLKQFAQKSMPEAMLTAGAGQVVEWA